MAIFLNRWILPIGVCVFILSPVKQGSTLFWDCIVSILSNRADTSQEGYCGPQPKEISAQSTKGYKKLDN